MDISVCIKNNQLYTIWYSGPIAKNTTLYYYYNHSYPMIITIANNMILKHFITYKLFIVDIKIKEFFILPNNFFCENITNSVINYFSSHDNIFIFPTKNLLINNN